MPSYTLVTYQSDKGPRAGIAVGDKLFDAAALTRKAGYASVLAILQDWGSAKGVLKKAAAAAGKSKLKSKPLAKAKLLAPVLWPSAFRRRPIRTTWGSSLGISSRRRAPSPATRRR